MCVAKIRQNFFPPKLSLTVSWSIFFLWAKSMTNLDKNDYKSKKKLQFERKKLNNRDGITNRSKRDYKLGQILGITNRVREITNGGHL